MGILLPVGFAILWKVAVSTLVKLGAFYCRIGECLKVILLR